MIPLPHGETVIRLRGTAATDPYSGETTSVDWSDPDDLALEGCAVWPGDTAEPLRDARTMVVSDYVVAAPAGSDVLASDRVVIRGRTCQVVGDPFDWRSPFTGWQPGTIIQANVVEG